MFTRSAILLFLSLAPLLLYAQSKNYSIVNYTAEQGLPQNSITGIEFDKKGYCWLGTEMGLARFDGKWFKVFGTAEIKGLRSERIRMMSTDTNGHIW